MDFFMMHQDPRVNNIAKLLPGLLNPQSLTHGQIREISTTVILYIKENRQNQYPDFMGEAGLLVSEKLKQVMGKYQSNLVFKTIVLMERTTNRQEIYYLMAPPSIDCASERTIYDSRGHVKEFVLDEEKVGYARIFCATNFGKHVFVRLDVAESILRRDPYGVLFEKVSVDSRSIVGR